MHFWSSPFSKKQKPFYYISSDHPLFNWRSIQIFLLIFIFSYRCRKTINLLHFCNLIFYFINYFFFLLTEAACLLLVALTDLIFQKLIALVIFKELIRFNQFFLNLREGLYFSKEPETYALLRLNHNLSNSES